MDTHEDVCRLCKGTGEVSVDRALQQHADAIKSLGKRVISDVIEIGRRLTEAKSICGHGNWLPWLQHNFGWTDRTALNFMRVYEAFGSKSENVSDLNLPLSSLYLLAQPSTPAEVRQEVMDRAGSGEAVSHREVKEMVSLAREVDDDDPPPKRGETIPRDPPRLLVGAEFDAKVSNISWMVRQAHKLIAPHIDTLSKAWVEGTVEELLVVIDNLKTLTDAIRKHQPNPRGHLHVVAGGAAEIDIVAQTLRLFEAMTDEQREQFVREACIDQLMRGAMIPTPPPRTH